MYLKALVISLFATTALASQEQQWAVKRSDVSAASATATAATTQTIDYAKVSSQLQALMGQITVAAIVPSPTVTLAISIPSSLRNEIVTAVPPDVIVKLVDPGYRSSVASEFAAGNTPSWYQSLNPDLKTFFESMAKEIKTGSAVYTETPTITATSGVSDATGDSSVESTSSSGLAPAPTAVGREMMAGMWAIAGAAGMALML